MSSKEGENSKGWRTKQSNLTDTSSWTHKFWVGYKIGWLVVGFIVHSVGCTLGRAPTELLVILTFNVYISLFYQFDPTN